MKFQFGPRAYGLLFITAGIAIKFGALHYGVTGVALDITKDASMLFGAGLAVFQHPTNPA